MKILDSISKETIKRYSDRYDKHGKNIRTLGWGNIEQQMLRFEKVCENINFKDKKVLDIGCGFGDLFAYLKKNDFDIKKYYGWDINVNFINEANKRFKGKNFKFEVKDILKKNESEDRFDITIMLGLLNFNLKNNMNNYDYSKLIINKAFNFVDEVLVIDFLSSYRTEEYPKEDFVFYHEPEKIIKIISKISNNFTIKHNYKPIPQKEFLVYLYR